MLPIVMARLEERERITLSEPWNRAFRQALCDPRVRLSFKAAALTMKLDEGQLERQLAGVETLDPRRLALLAMACPSFIGPFLAALADELGGWPEVMSHGLVGFLSPLFVTAGQARMARAVLDSPRSREERACDGGSLRVSA